MSSSSWQEFTERDAVARVSADGVRADRENEGQHLPREVGSVPLAPASGQDRLIVRVVAGLSGVLGAGTLLLGGVMLVIMVVLGIRDGQTNDLVVTTGPGWSRTWVQLAGGLACEALNWGVRRQRSPVVRVIAGLTGIASALAVLWWVWWR